MAKALLGYIAQSPDRRLVEEITSLRCRVRDLEAEIERLRSQSDSDLDDRLRELSSTEQLSPVSV